MNGRAVARVLAIWGLTIFSAISVATATSSARAADGASVATGNADELRKALEVERQRVLLTDEERDLNRETIAALEKRLHDAEAKLRDRKVALDEAHEVSRQGLANQSQHEKLGGPPPTPQTTGQDVARESEIAETALGLSITDRQRLQLALAGLGFDPGGADGVFGPRSRQAIKAWQKARDLEQSGFLDGMQRQTLQREAAPTLARYDVEQKKIAEQKKIEEARLRAMPPPQPPLQQETPPPPRVMVFRSPSFPPTLRPPPPGARPVFWPPVFVPAHRRYHRY
jgi:peptidoglycan hydrolase-like protein with peptidoglycan-binding domain